MAMMYGVEIGSEDFTDGNQTIRKTIPKAQFSTIDADGKKVTINEAVFAIVGDIAYYDAKGETAAKDTAAFAVVELTAEGTEIVISAGKFPGTYYVTGDTYARSQTTGDDEFYQFIVPKAKMLSEVTLTMEAEGDPSTFNMSLKVLRPDDGKMMKLVKYGAPEAATGDS